MWRQNRVVGKLDSHFDTLPHLRKLLMTGSAMLLHALVGAVLMAFVLLAYQAAYQVFCSSKGSNAWCASFSFSPLPNSAHYWSRALQYWHHLLLMHPLSLSLRHISMRSMLLAWHESFALADGYNLSSPIPHPGSLPNATPFFCPALHKALPRYPIPGPLLLLALGQTRLLIEEVQ